MPESTLQSDRGFSAEWQSLWSRVAESIVRMAESNFMVQGLQYKTYSAELTVQSLQCRAYSAEPTAQSLQCRAYSAEPTVQSLQCRAYSAEPTVQSLQCRVAESTMQIGTVDSEGLQRLQPGVTEPTVQSGRGYRAESQTTDRRVLIAEWQSLAIVQS